MESPFNSSVINVLSVESIMVTLTFSPVVNVPTKFLVLIKSSKIGTELIVFCAVLSTIAVAPEVAPVICLFSNKPKSKLV